MHVCTLTRIYMPEYAVLQRKVFYDYLHFKPNENETNDKGSAVKRFENIFPVTQRARCISQVMSGYLVSIGCKIIENSFSGKELFQVQ